MSKSANLTVDRGNTLTKLAVWSDRQLVDYRCFEHDDLDAMSEMATDYDIAHALVCSVASPADDIIAAIRPAVDDIAQLDHSTPVPVTIGYRNQQQLGIDRVAAACGAISLVSHCDLLVVDAGTAVTYDYVTADAHFVGGNIAPGIGMRLHALHDFTARLPEVSTDGDTPQWGRSTDEAMRSGAVNGVVAELLYHRSLLPPTTAVVIGGGDAEIIASRIPFKVIREPHLVSLGLNNIIEYNRVISNQ